MFLKHIKILLLSLFCLSQVALHAQEEADTSVNLNIKELEDLDWMMDTTYKVFKTKRFSNMQTVFPSFKSYKAFISKSEAGKQTEYTQFAMYNAVWNSLRFQYTKTMKKAQDAKVEWKQTQLDTFYYEHSYYSGVEYAYVTWVILTVKNKKFKITATCLKMDDKWFIMDELKFAGIVVPPKTKKKK
jgi:hypothetical protein